MDSFQRSIADRIRDAKKALDENTVQCQLCDGRIQAIESILELTKTPDTSPGFMMVVSAWEREERIKFSELEAARNVITGAIEILEKAQDSYIGYKVSAKKLSDDLVEQINGICDDLEKNSNTQTKGIVNANHKRIESGLRIKR